MRFPFAPFAVLALLSLATPSIYADDIPSHVQKANAAAARKDWNGAIAELDAIIALDKNNTEAYAGKSLMLIQKGDLVGALIALDRVIEIDPKDAQAYQTRAGLHQKMGHNEQAKHDFEKALQLSPDERAKLVTGAQKALDDKDWQKAHTMWAMLAEAVPTDPRGHYGAGLALFHGVNGIDYLTAPFDRKAVYNKQLAQAKVDFQAAIDADPKFVPAYLALIEKKIGTRSDEEYKSALATLNKGIQLVPNNAALYVARAGLSKGLVPTEALLKSQSDDYNRALQLDSNSAEALSGLAWNYHLSKRDIEALPLINRALALKADDAELLTHRAGIYETLGDWEQSADDYGRVYALDPSKSSIALSQYLALTHLPDTKRALDAISALIAKEPKNALYLRLRAELFLARKEYSPALADVDASLAIEADNASAKALREKIVAAQMVVPVLPQDSAVSVAKPPATPKKVAAPKSPVSSKPTTRPKKK